MTFSSKPQQVLSNRSLKTDKTNKTNIPATNTGFLSAIFGEVNEVHCPIIVSFAGNPYEVEKDKWFGRPWLLEQSVSLDPKNNNYFSLSSFRPNDSGVYRRRKSDFVALYALMLDDIGTKVSLDSIKISPSWKLETSSGNYQFGFLFAEAISEPKVADRIMEAVIAAGLCDPGAGGPCSRLARLPQGTNGKYTPEFACRLMDWQPEKKFTLDELADGLGLELGASAKKIATKNNAFRDASTWIPRAKNDPILVAFKRSGLLKDSVKDGVYEVTCPWVSDHTNHVDGGSAYFAPSEDFPVGGYKCHHGHCVQRSIGDVLAFFNIDAARARQLPTVRLIPGEFANVLESAEKLLINKSYFERGGHIVKIHYDRESKDTKVLDVNKAQLRRALATHGVWESYDERKQAYKRIDPPDWVAANLCDAGAFPHLEPLVAVARQPFFRPDRSLVQDAGYDKATRTFSAFTPADFLIAEKPTKDDAVEALDRLCSLLSEFDFKSDFDRSAALSAMLTAAIRPTLPTAPMFHVAAHMIGSGKSFLTSLISAFATPQESIPCSYPSEQEEMRKLLIAQLLLAPAVIVFDNLTTDLLPHKSLCTVLTSSYFSDRILSVSKTATVGTKVLVLSSGNNVYAIGDMSRRTVTIHLAPQVEVPAARNFKNPNLLNDIASHRSMYVSAAITVISAWIAAGEPLTSCRPVGSFGDWSALCRQPLLWLGLPDPANCVFEAMAQDPARESLQRLMAAWSPIFGSQSIMVRELVRRATHAFTDCENLREVLLEIAGERENIDRRRLGWWLKRHAGQIIDGKRIVNAGGDGPACRWRVESVSSVSLVVS